MVLHYRNEPHEHGPCVLDIEDWLQLSAQLHGKIVPSRHLRLFHIPAWGDVGVRSIEDGEDRLGARQLLRMRIAQRNVSQNAGFVAREGGIHVAPADFLRALRDTADRYKIALIVDEVQAGIARTGKMFAIEHSGVVPDIITTAKGLGGGFPLAGVIGRASLMDAAHVGSLGGTFAGSPIGIAGALAVLDLIGTENLCARAAEIGKKICARLYALSSELACIGDVRGVGAMQALELVEDRQTRAPATALAAAVLQCAQARGLVLLSCGASANAIRLLPPLTISDQLLEEGLDILETAIRAAITQVSGGSDVGLPKARQKPGRKEAV